jgi:hypothetical protein
MASAIFGGFNSPPSDAENTEFRRVDLLILKPFRKAPYKNFAQSFSWRLSVASVIFGEFNFSAEPSRKHRVSPNFISLQ